jgi:hypothetical protein
LHVMSPLNALLSDRTAATISQIQQKQRNNLIPSSLQFNSPSNLEHSQADPFERRTQREQRNPAAGKSSAFRVDGRSSKRHPSKREPTKPWMRPFARCARRAGEKPTSMNRNDCSIRPAKLNAQHGLRVRRRSATGHLSASVLHRSWVRFRSADSTDQRNTF